MGRKPALHSSCSKTGAKVGISMLIDKHCQLKSCNPCQPTRACMPHWAARRPQQAHGSPGSEDDSYAPTHDDPRLTDERLKKTPTPTTVPHPANPKRNNHRTWTPECLWACDKEAVQFGHRAQQRAVHIPLSHIQQGESLVPAKFITPHRGDYGYDIIPAHQKRPASDKASFFSTHMVWPRHSNPNDFNTELLMRCDLLSNSYLCSICDSRASLHRRELVVVICFQILTFAVSATANGAHTFLAAQL